MKAEDIARIAHEINRALCASHGDKSHRAWSHTKKDERDGKVAAVAYLMDNAAVSPEQQHAAWLESKAADGWTHGKEKDVDKKKHPCMKPWDELEDIQKAKDYVFKMVVSQLAALPEPVVPASAPAEVVLTDRLPVVYHGHGGNRATNRDTLYGTGLVFNYGENTLVPIAVAKAMVTNHPDTYRMGTTEDAADKPAAQVKPETEEDKAQQELQGMLDSVANMDKATLTTFAQTNFRMALVDGTVADMRAQVTRLIDQYGLK